MSSRRRDIKRLTVLVKLGVSADQLERAFEKFKVKFSGKPYSWFYRCKLRLVDVYSTPKPNMWIVRGRGSLGDCEAFYVVTFHPKDKVYSCTCYDPKKLFAAIRMKRICKHVGRVIVWRMIKEKSMDDFLDY